MRTCYQRLMQIPKPAYFILLDPDKSSIDEVCELSINAEKYGVDAILIGSSFLLEDNLDEYILHIKERVSIPVIIFPGILNTLSPEADAILFLNMISSRNPQLLIGEQVRAAPYIKHHNLEAISTAYILIESGNLTTVQYMSNSLPIPRNKAEIVIAHILAAEFMGMKLVYLEAGSGAQSPVPVEMISQVKSVVSLPLIVGGGIKTPQAAYDIAQAGADFIVTGSILENSKENSIIKEFADAVHSCRK